MSHFEVFSKKKLSSLDEGTIIPTSDYATLTPDGVFVQLKYVETEQSISQYEVKPGIWSIVKTLEGLKLEPTSFTQDSILDNFVKTKDVESKVDCFFNKLHIYKKYGFEIPKRGVLLYGPAGTGKTSVLKKVCQKYAQDKRTAIVLWETYKFESYMVKDFIKSFKYTDVDKIILIAEDLGGVEVSEAKRPSDSAMLALLDNQEKTFTIPVLIIATTNFPEMFMENLTNRPQRFDDKIEVSYPDGEARKALLQFFAAKNDVVLDEETTLLITDKKCNEFTPAHIKEVIIRSELYDKTMPTVIKELLEEIEKYKKAFQKNRGLGFGN